MSPDAEVLRLPDPEKRKILSLITERVRIRFSLSADAFADRVLDLIGRPEGAAELRLSKLSFDDLYLAASCAEGDDKAWKECADRHFGFVRDFARRYLPRAEAAELAEQVIVDLWERGKMRRYEGRSSLRTWLGAVVAHAALNVLKGQRTTVDTHDEELRALRQRGNAASAQDIAAGAEASPFALLASEALANLEAADKLLVLLYYEQGLTLDKIGVALHASKTVVSRRLKRVREKLRETMESIAERRWGTSAEALRQGVDLSRMELDLERLLSGRAEPLRPKVV